MTLNIAAYQPGNPYIAALATETSSGRAISGAEQLVQRFLMELTTTSESMPFALDRGCHFITDLVGGILNEADLITAFGNAMLIITPNLTTEETADDLDTERFASANITHIAISPGFVTMSVTLTNRGGQLTNLVVPLSLRPTPINIAEPLD